MISWTGHREGGGGAHKLMGTKARLHGGHAGGLDPESRRNLILTPRNAQAKMRSVGMWLRGRTGAWDPLGIAVGAAFRGGGVPQRGGAFAYRSLGFTSRTSKNNFQDLSR